MFNRSTVATPYSGEEGNHVKVYVPVAVAIVVLCCAAILIVIYVRRRQRSKRNEVHSADAKSPATDIANSIDSTNNGNHSYADIEEAQYYNTQNKQAIDHVEENEYYNDNSRRVSGVEEDEYGYGKFVKKSTDSGVQNYTFVTDENKMKADVDESMYVNSEPIKATLPTNVTDVNHNAYSSHSNTQALSELGESACSREDSVYDHTHITSSHRSTSDADRYSKGQGYTHVHLNGGDVNSRISDGDISQINNVYSCLNCGKEAGSVVPLSVEKVRYGTVDAELYCNCTLERSRMLKEAEEEKHNVEGVTEDDTKCDDYGTSQNHVYFVLEKIEHET